MVEFGVLPEAQGRGLGGRLHGALLAGIANQRLILTTRQADTAARRLYARRGWQELRSDYFFHGNAHPYILLGLERPALGAPQP